MPAFKHSFLPRDKVVERLKAGEKLVHRTFRNEDGVVLSSSTIFENDHTGVTIHLRTFEYLCVHRLIRRVGVEPPTDEIYEYRGP